jgi:transcriptional regulator with XRE-family HTH domain
METASWLNKVFGEQLRTIRNAAGITQEELAFRTGLDRTYISLLERGIKGPSLYTFFRLCEVLGQKPEEFIAKIQSALERKETAIVCSQPIADEKKEYLNENLNTPR